MTSTTTTETRNQIVRLVRDFVKREVKPVAAEHDRAEVALAWWNKLGTYPLKPAPLPLLRYHVPR